MPRSPLARPRPRRDRPSLRAAAALGASLALNAAAFAGLALAGAFSLPQRPARVALATLSAEAWEANRTALGAPAEPPAAPAPDRSPAPAPAAPAEPERVPRGLVVQVAPSPDSRSPERARFVADRDNTVPRDVQSRIVGRDGQAVAARVTAGAGASTQGIAESGEEGGADESIPGAEGSAADRVEAARAALAPTAADGEGSRAGAAAGRGAGEGGARRAGRFDPRLLPVGIAFAQVPGGAPKDQHLPGVPEGDETRLNTRRFRYADFYSRVDAAIRREWEPDREWSVRDPQDRVYGRATRVARIDIVLALDGTLREARLVSSSGLDFYDRECLRAIRAAAPFPNPPRGLAGPDGLIVLANWGLTFTFDRAPALARPGL